MTENSRPTVPSKGGLQNSSQLGVSVRNVQAVAICQLVDNIPKGQQTAIDQATLSESHALCVAVGNSLTASQIHKILWQQWCRGEAR